jgi:hypothetical protein
VLEGKDSGFAAYPQEDWMGSPGEQDSLSGIGIEVDSRFLNNGWWEQVGPHTATQLNWEAGELRKGSHVGSQGSCVGSQN